MILGVDMRLYVGGNIPQSLDVVCFARTSRVLIGTADAFAMELGPLLLKSPPRGSLART